MAKVTNKAPKKATKKTTKKDEEEVKLNYCTMQISEKCNEAKGMIPESEFYTSVAAEIYANGRYNICKNCMKEYVYDSKGEINLDRLKKILRIYDLPFLEKDFRSAITSKTETLGLYMRCMNLNRSDKTWLDSDGLNLSLENLKGEEPFTVTKKMIKKWGKGLSDEDYEDLEDIYKEWVSKHKSDTLAEQKTFKYIAMKEFDILKARETGGNVKDAEESLRKFMSNANVVPKEIKEVSSTDSEEAWGVFINIIEKVRPAEHYKDKKIYFDFDGLLDYLNRFVFRPLKNILAKTKEYDREFNVEDGGGFMDKEIKEKYDYGNGFEEDKKNDEINKAKIKNDKEIKNNDESSNEDFDF